MVGAILGFLISLGCCLFAGATWWWLLWGALIGVGFEILSRISSGEDFSEAVDGIISDFDEAVGD